MSLARPYRLNGSGVLARTFRQGKTVRYSGFFIRYLPNGLARNRLAITVPRAVSSKAVVRNRLRRVISENIKEFFRNGAGWDVAIVALPTILKKHSSEINSELQQAISQIIVK